MPKNEHILSGRAVARMYGISETTVRRARDDRRIIDIEAGVNKGKYDISDPINKRGFELILANLQAGDKRTITKKKKKQKTINKKDVVAPLEPEYSEEDLLSSNDVGFLKILKVKQDIEEKRLKNEKFRGELVEGKAVARVFNKLWSVDSSQLTPMATKLAPDLASICGVSDPEIITKMRELIDKEIWRVLGHQKRLMVDYLSTIGEETIVEDEG